MPKESDFAIFFYKSKANTVEIRDFDLLDRLESPDRSIIKVARASLRNDSKLRTDSICGTK